MLRWYVPFDAFFLNLLLSLPSLITTHPHPPQAHSLVLHTSSTHRTRLLAASLAEKVKEVLEELPESVAKDGLVVLTERVVRRRS